MTVCKFEDQLKREKENNETCKDVLHTKCWNAGSGPMEVLQEHQERAYAIGQKAKHTWLTVEARRKPAC